MRFPFPILALLALAMCGSLRASTNDFTQVQAIFNEHCLDCHESKEPEGKLVMEDFETLMKGGESGPAIVPGKSSESLLVKLIEGFEKDGKKKIMPPGKREKLKSNEIALIRGWIDTGAQPPADDRPKEFAVPKIAPKVPPRRSIHELAYEPKSRLLAVAVPGEVELRSVDSRAVVRTLSGHRGHVNAVAFSADGKHLFAAAGEPGLFGEVRQWSVNDGKLVRVFEGHKDALYSVAISPDGQTLATGSYDQKIKLWKVETGEELKTLSGHNGCVFDLAFRPDGKILGSASADRTVKLWDVSSGERRDTLSQSLKELYAVAFTPDGKRVAAGGVDNRIRVWEVSEKAAETTNPLLHSKFAHEGAILRIVFSTDGKKIASSADDRTVKIFDASEVKQELAIDSQSDWAPGLAFIADNKGLAVGRLDGTLEYYDTTSGKAMPPPKPELARAEPRGFQRGHELQVKLVGSNLLGITEVKSHHTKLEAELSKETKPTEILIKVKTPSDLPRGAYELSVKGSGGESGKLKIHVDDLPQLYEVAKTTTTALTNTPVSCWGTLDKMGDNDEWEIIASAGETIIFDVAAKSLGSKANPVLTLSDGQGKVLASNNDYDGVDPLIAYKVPADGKYRLRISDLMLGASEDHFYRLSVGSLPLVTGCYPIGVQTNVETEVELIGFNLPAEHTVKIKPDKVGDVDLPIDPEKFRPRRTFKVVASDLPDVLESEPNDTMETATKISNPGVANGRIWNGKGGQDSDLFAFDATSGQNLVITTTGAMRGSPVDTKIEILHADGKAVERLLLQAVRDSAITFRAIDSVQLEARVDNWEEMDLDEFLYMQGEVVKLFRAPQGPDSGFVFYKAGEKKRRTYFDTSSAAHANEEACYIVRPHPPGTKVAPNGLPVFPLYYANDDDAERKLGADSRVYFTPPTNGTYLVRVTDTRGFRGERFVYRLSVREAQPDFKVTLEGGNPTVPVGSGQSFTLNVDRIDGFEGEIKVDITGLPPGFIVSTPIIVQAGHTEARGTIFANPAAPKPDETNAAMSKIVASAIVNGKTVTKNVKNFGTIKLGDKPKLFVAFEPYVEGQTNSYTDAEPLELTIAPGQSIPAWLKIRRNGHDDLVTFQVDNLPHGVIVDNIGLNGVLIPKDQNERQIFLSAAKWVPETDRLCFAIENQAGKQTSRPVLLKVRNPANITASR